MSIATNQNEAITTMEMMERQIFFMIGNNIVIYHFPLDKYKSGDMKEVRERIAEKLNCNPGEVKVRITGVLS